MKKYVLAVVLFLLLPLTAFSEQAYSYMGTVIEQSGDASTITIDYIQYAVDNNTTVHGGLAMPGETGPSFAAGQKLGFNIELVSGQLPRITDIWILSDDSQ